MAASLNAARLALALLAFAGCASDDLSEPPAESPAPVAAAPAEPVAKAEAPASSATTAPDAPSSPASKAELELTVQAWSSWSERFGPYAWRATFRSDRTAEFSGLSFSARKGEYTAELPENVWEQIEAAIEALKLDDEKQELQSFEPAGREVPDGTTVRLVIRHEDRTWTLQDHAESAYAAVLTLEQTVAWAVRSREVEWRTKVP